MPNDVLALIAFLGALSPGLLYLYRVENFRLRPDRNPTLTVAEVLVFGSAATVLSSLIVTPLAMLVDRTFPREWIIGGSRYFAREPLLLVGWGIGILVLSHGLAYLAARIKTRNEERILFPGSSAWTKLLVSSGAIDTQCTVRLNDGRIISGYVYAYDVKPSPTGDQDLALQKPIFERTAGNPPALASGIDFLIISRRNIESIVEVHYRHNTRDRAWQEEVNS